MLGKNLVDFIHPEEKEAAKNDFAKFRSSTTIFGSVTRYVHDLDQPLSRRRIADQETDVDTRDQSIAEGSWEQ